MREQEHTNTQSPVDISVIMATLNRDEHLRRTLDAYRSLDTTGIRWELIVVDNNSTDNTAGVLDAFVSRLPLKRLFVAEGGKNRALNEALSIIGGALVIFTDDDALPDPHCFQAYLAAAQRWPTEAIFGARIEPRFPDNTRAWIRDPEFRFATTAFARYAPAAAEERVSRHPYGPSFAVRRYALANHRFATHLGPQSGAYAMGGESHFLRALQRDGWAYVYVPSARVEHVIRPDQITPQWLLQRANKKGRGQVYLPSDKTPRRLLWRGVSIRLWLAAARAGLRYLAARAVLEPKVYTGFGIRYQLRRGQIQELLAQRRASATKPAREPESIE